MTNTGIELIGLFQVQPPARRGFPYFAISTAMHGFGAGVMFWALLHHPRIIAQPLSKLDKVRHLELHVPDSPVTHAAEAFYPRENSTPNPTKRLDSHAAAERGAGQMAQADPRLSAVPAIRLPDGGQGKQILVQPDLPKVVLAQETPLPSVVMWKPERTRVNNLVAPAPEKPSTVDVQTSLQVPNEELQVADLPQASAEHVPTIKTAPAGSSSPIAVKAQTDVKTAPATASTPTAQPTPAAVLSVSDIRMPQGTVALPPVNETRGNTNKEGAPAGEVNGTSQAAKVSGSAKPSGVNAQKAGAAISDAQKAGPEQFAAGESAEHIQRPKDGKFGVVVVGSSLSDQYPETLQIWSDRVAYTAYLHVGTPKAWILQYAQLRQTDAAAGGGVTHLDAPWPYEILRPNMLSKDLNADALMVHGVLNASGRLENLAIAYPQGYVHASFVLRELQQWQFRPAQQLGKPTPVEVLLIIPEEND